MTAITMKIRGLLYKFVGKKTVIIIILASLALGFVYGLPYFPPFPFPFSSLIQIPSSSPSSPSTSSSSTSNNNTNNNNTIFKKMNADFYPSSVTTFIHLVSSLFGPVTGFPATETQSEKQILSRAQVFAAFQMESVGADGSSALGLLHLARFGPLSFYRQRAPITASPSKMPIGVSTFDASNIQHNKIEVFTTLLPEGMSSCDDLTISHISKARSDFQRDGNVNNLLLCLPPRHLEVYNSLPSPIKYCFEWIQASFYRSPSSSSSSSSSGAFTCTVHAPILLPSSTPQCVVVYCPSCASPRPERHNHNLYDVEFHNFIEIDRTTTLLLIAAVSLHWLYARSSGNNPLVRGVAHSCNSVAVVVWRLAQPIFEFIFARDIARMVFILSACSILLVLSLLMLHDLGDFFFGSGTNLLHAALELLLLVVLSPSYVMEEEERKRRIGYLVPCVYTVLYLFALWRNAYLCVSAVVHYLVVRHFPFRLLRDAWGSVISFVKACTTNTNTNTNTNNNYNDGRHLHGRHNLQQQQQQQPQGETAARRSTRSAADSSNSPSRHSAAGTTPVRRSHTVAPQHQNASAGNIFAVLSLLASSASPAGGNGRLSTSSSASP